MLSCQNSFRLFYYYLRFSMHIALALPWPEMGCVPLHSGQGKLLSALFLLFYSSYQHCSCRFLELCCCPSSPDQHHKLKTTRAALVTLMTDVCFLVTDTLEEGVLGQYWRQSRYSTIAKQTSYSMSGLYLSLQVFLGGGGCIGTWP